MRTGAALSHANPVPQLAAPAAAGSSDLGGSQSTANNVTIGFIMSRLELVKAMNAAPS